MTAKEIGLRVVSIFILWRGSLFLLDFLGLHLTEEFDFFGKYLHAEGILNARKTWQAFPESPFFDSFFRFDSGWYERIVLRGYYLEGSQSNVAFFPLFPYLSRWLGYLVGNYFVAGWIVANLGLLGGIYYIYRIGLLYWRRIAVERSIFLFLVFPSSFFLSAFYSEGLFLLTTTASFYYFLTHRYLGAGVWGMLAALTRLNGVLLFPCFLGELLWQYWREKKAIPLSTACLLLIPAGLGIFMGILWLAVGEPLAFLHIQASWGKEPTFFLQTLFNALAHTDLSFPRKPFAILGLLDTIAAIAFLALAGLMATQKIAPSLWIYVALSVIVPLSAGNTQSMLRFCSVLFPAFYYLAQVTRRRPMAYHYLVFTFAFLLSICNLRFMNWFYMV